MAGKPTSRSAQSKRKSSNSSGSKARTSGNSSGSKSRAAASGATKARPTRAAGSTRSSAAAATRKAQAEAEAARDSNGFVGTVKQVASKAKGPAIAVGAAVGAAAAGAAGGALLRDRTRKKKVLGVPVPRSFGKSKVTDLDLPEVVKSVGRASQQFGQKTKSVSSDMEHVGDRAERFGKMLS
jgi:hypothetical protein